MHNPHSAVQRWWGCRHRAALARLEGKEWKSLLVPFPWGLVLAWGYLSLLGVIVVGVVGLGVYLTWPLSGIFVGIMVGLIIFAVSVLAALEYIDKV